MMPVLAYPKLATYREQLKSILNPWYVDKFPKARARVREDGLCGYSFKCNWALRYGWKYTDRAAPKRDIVADVVKKLHDAKFPLCVTTSLAEARKLVNKLNEPVVYVWVADNATRAWLVTNRKDAVK